jgi:hypothetical protein
MQMVGTTLPFMAMTWRCRPWSLMDHSVYSIMSWTSGGRAAIDSIM